MTSRSGTARPPSPCPTTFSASRTAASGSTPASAARSRVLVLGVTTVAGVRIGVLPWEKQEGQDQPGAEPANVGEEAAPSAARLIVEKVVEALQQDPVANKDVGGQR